MLYIHRHAAPVNTANCAREKHRTLKAWQVPLGTTRDLVPLPIGFNWGTPNLGGSVVIPGGLVFIGATADKYFRTFDVNTGEELWRHRIPYTANALPIMYRLSKEGRSYIVVAAGGHSWSKSGDAILAFALPD